MKMLQYGKTLSSIGRFLCLDLETTCWTQPEKENLSFKQPEIIEIGAALYTYDSRTQFGGGIRGTFQHFVRPTKNPQLSKFCTELTGIQQTLVDHAPEFPEAWRKFLEAVDPLQPFVFASWGDFDRHAIKAHLDRFNVGLRCHPFPLHLNVKDWFGNVTGNGKIGLGEAVELCGMQFKGRAHSGVDDAYNTAMVVDWMIRLENK